MITSPIKLRMTRNWFDSGLTRTSYHGNVPAPTLKRGKRAFKLCADGFAQFYAIPKDATDIRMVATKRPAEGAYKITRTKDNWRGFVFKLDGFELPGLYSGAATCLRSLLADGYTYLRFDYKLAS